MGFGRFPKPHGGGAIHAGLSLGRLFINKLMKNQHFCSHHEPAYAKRVPGLAGSPIYQIAGLLNCQIARLLDCQIPRLPDCQIVGLLDCQIARLPDCWIARLPDCWTVRMSD